MPLKRRKLPTFNATVATTKVKLKNKIVTLKEERRLLTRFLIAYKERPEIDLPSHIGRYEFSVVPRSMFHSDGSMIFASDKSSLMHEIKKITKGDSSCDEDSVRDAEQDRALHRVIMFDGMGVVNKLKKSDAIRTCKDLAAVFVQRILGESNNYQVVAMIFDRYMVSSLKSKTRNKRTKGVSVHYKIADNMNIENVSLKSLLSHVHTKMELTAYLGEKLVSACKTIQKDFIVIYENKCKTNLPVLQDVLIHEQEEADTLMILYGIVITRLNPFQELVVCSPDTDVLLLLIYFHEQLCSSTIFRTGRSNQVRDINIGLAHEALGEERSKALLGFHCFTGCDQTAKFYGKSKLACWKVFCSSPSWVLDAFSQLGNRSDNITYVRDGLYHFVLELYCKNRPQQVTDIPRARWQLYSKQQVESEKLPPTPSALDFKIQRSDYISKIWTSADQPRPILPSPEDFCWKLQDEMYEAIMTDQPVPNAMVELSFCRCKTGCKTNRCKCRKNEMSCTEMCYCEDCENDDDNENCSWSDEEDEDNGDDDDSENES